jgi:hypothetical protein
MHQYLRKFAPIKARGGQGGPRRACWPKFFWYPVIALGVLMMVLTLRLGVGHALERHAWQKVSPAAGFAVYAAAHSPKWDKPLLTLTSDSDDDDGDDDGDDCPTTAT